MGVDILGVDILGRTRPHLLYDDCLLSLTTPPPLQKAKKKPLAKLTPQELGIDVAPRLSVLSVEDPPTREAGSKVADVDELISKLKDVGVI